MLSVLLFFKLLFFLTPNEADEIPRSIYAYRVASLDGKEIDFSTFRGRKILIVNTASECGYTPQYEALEKLYKNNKDKLVVVGFPTNDFGKQEPGSNQEIMDFCQKNYGVSFPMAAKISVKGKDKATIYSWLTQKQYNGFEDSDVKWNFQKYLIDEQGKLICIFLPRTKPDSPEVLEAINR